jgi:hypothetical protein
MPTVGVPGNGVEFCWRGAAVLVLVPVSMLEPAVPVAASLLGFAGGAADGGADELVDEAADGGQAADGDVVVCGFAATGAGAGVELGEPDVRPEVGNDREAALVEAALAMAGFAQAAGSQGPVSGVAAAIRAELHPAFGTLACAEAAPTLLCEAATATIPPVSAIARAASRTDVSRTDARVLRLDCRCVPAISRLSDRSPSVGTWVTTPT